NIGFVFQQFNLIPNLNIYKNVELPMVYSNKYSKEERDLVIKEKLEIVGLLDKLYQKPLELSGGQQQRITIARALVNDPDIIFADEPT
ncbi:ATP-binding cassette domain-containing protein, partial [Casaltella massiliensis]|nr:ATP-binding cassette domain-containing protein [Casaltella massiliensis]